MQGSVSSPAHDVSTAAQHGDFAAGLRLVAQPFVTVGDFATRVGADPGRREMGDFATGLRTVVLYSALTGDFATDQRSRGAAIQRAAHSPREFAEPAAAAGWTPAPG